MPNAGALGKPPGARLFLHRPRKQTNQSNYMRVVSPVQYSSLPQHQRSMWRLPALRVFIKCRIGTRRKAKLKSRDALAAGTGNRVPTSTPARKAGRGYDESAMTRTEEPRH